MANRIRVARHNIFSRHEWECQNLKSSSLAEHQERTSASIPTNRGAPDQSEAFRLAPCPASSAPIDSLDRDLFSLSHVGDMVDTRRDLGETRRQDTHPCLVDRVSSCES